MSFRTTRNGHPTENSHQNSRSPHPVIPNPNEQPRPLPIGSVQTNQQSGRAVFEIKEAMEQFARGETDQANTIARIVRALAFKGDETDAAKGKALDSYINQMHQIERAQRRESGSELPGTISSRESPASSSRSVDNHGGSSHQSHRSDPISESRRNKRGRSEGRKEWRGGRGGKGKGHDGDDGGSGDSGGSDSSNEDEEEWPTSSASDSDSGGRERRKKRLREEDMPWFRKEKESRRSISRSCIRSAELLRTYSRDISKVKRWISYSASAPSGFPLSEWENLLKGKTVNLDVVYTSFFHVVAVRENRGRIGDHEISLGYTEPSRKVLTSGDWTAAWNSVVKAASFVFPHRRDELDAYGEFIQGEFTAREAIAHWKVIRFDQSVRNEVGGGTKILLTDFHRFDRHRAAILQADGLFATPDAKQSARRSKSNDLCIRYNSEAGCVNGSNNCRYRHTCRKCGKGGHGAPACEGKK